MLREKIEKETNIKIDAPEFGETYELDNINVEMTHKIERKIDKTVRVEILERLEIRLVLCSRILITSL